MAFIHKEIKDGKKVYAIIWLDANKGKGKNGRRYVSCNKYKATNAEQRKILLKKYQELEDKVKRDVKLFGIKEEKEKLLDEAIDDYIKYKEEEAEIRKRSKGRGGIAPSTLIDIKHSITLFKTYCETMKIKYCSDFTPDKSQKYKMWLFKTKDKASSQTINKIMRNTKTFFNHFALTDPPVFKGIERINQAMKQIRNKEHLPFHFKTDELREILEKAIEFDAQTCTITRESKDKGKSFKGELPSKYNPILPMIFLVMLTGMRKSDALNLKWENVNLNTGLIRYQAIKNDKICTVPLIGDPNGEISSEFLEILKQWRNERPKDKFVLPHPKSDTPTELKHTITKFKKSLKPETGKNFNWQNLRKNFESYAVSFGIPPAITAFWVGHSPAVAEKHYMSYAIGKLNANNIASAMSISDLIWEQFR